MKLLFLRMILVASTLVCSQSINITCDECISKGCIYCNPLAPNTTFVCSCGGEHSWMGMSCGGNHQAFHVKRDCENAGYSVHTSGGSYYGVLFIAFIICSLVGLCVWWCAKGVSSAQPHRHNFDNHHHNFDNHHHDVANHHAIATAHAVTHSNGCSNI
jgi:hypothetical protein